MPSRDSDVHTSVERADPLVGTIFDKRFRIEERIATGGFGAIYRATHVKSGHPIALKVLLPSLAQDLGVVARFRREGDTLTALRNPHTITAYELAQAADRTLFIVMELLHGESLFERYKANGPFEWKRMVRIAHQVCESLEEAHAAGIVHRDLKPTNIHLETKADDVDFVKVLDFGIAKILRGSDFDAADITNAGQMIGTLDYMSPEQMVGAKVTGQSDIYTVGIVMYEMIAGCTPFPEAMTAAQALAAVMKTKPDPLYLRAPVPEELDRIVMRCLQRDIETRYQTVAELRGDLERLLGGAAPDRARAVDTKPVEKHDEATQFTPPPIGLVDRSRRDDPWAPEATTAAQPSAQLLAEARRPKRPSVEEATQFTPPPEKLIAESRRPKRPSAEEATQFTPPPEKLLAQMRDARANADDEWSDEDEYAPTTNRRPAGAPPPRSSPGHEGVTKIAHMSEISDVLAQTGDDYDGVSVRPSEERVTEVARLADVGKRIPPRAQGGRDMSDRAMTLPRDEVDRAMTVPRESKSDRDMTLPRTLPPRNEDSGLEFPTPPMPAASPPTVSMRSSARSASAPPPQSPAVPRTLTPQQPPPVPQAPGIPTPRPLGRYETPVPALVAAPFSQPRPPSNPPPLAQPPASSVPPPLSPMPPRQSAVMPTPYPQAPGAIPTPYPQQYAPPTPVPGPYMQQQYGTQQPGYPQYQQSAPNDWLAPVGAQVPQRTTKSFDMGKMAAREAAIRKLIWIIVAVVAIGGGVVLATQL
ncbi:MAG TPA: protein kinase [Kofleriaceae bacterium]|nr:protein kinase [Kofleriaceae bacterium]